MSSSPVPSEDDSSVDFPSLSQRLVALSRFSPHKIQFEITVHTQRKHDMLVNPQNKKNEKSLSLSLSLNYLKSKCQSAAVSVVPNVECNGKRGGATFQRCSGLENVAPESKNIAPTLRESIQGHVL